MSLMSNADYVKKELPNVELPTDMRASIESLCSDWIGSRFGYAGERAVLGGLQMGDAARRRRHADPVH